MTTQAAEEDLVSLVESTAPFGRADAEAAVEATLEALGAALLPSERRALAEYVPRAFLAAFRSATPVPNLDLDAFFHRVARHERARPGRGREHAQIVCRALSEMLSEDVRQGLVRHVPWLAPLFQLDERPAPPEEIPHERPHPETPSDPLEGRNTLARGRPGSRHPLSTSRPDRAQTHSVARSDGPHEDTKLSSARGTTQERESETLSTGRPGPRRPLGG
ncbi:MAG TPA: DUF2267 domain-containing protein [Polyangiaceae bacterium]|nr:DUF2267 domain-containing protein [Polyangiaceae bacterium]